MSLSATASVNFKNGSTTTVVINAGNKEDLGQKLREARELKDSLMAVGTTDGKDAFIDANDIDELVVQVWNE